MESKATGVSELLCWRGGERLERCNGKKALSEALKTCKAAVLADHGCRSEVGVLGC